MHDGPKMVVMVLALGAAGLGLGCGGGEPTVTERLWVSDMPSSPRQHISAFVTMRGDDDGYLGAFFEGTLLRGSHDVFRWTDQGKDRAQVVLLQDKQEIKLRLEACTPSKGFHYCMEVYGDPTGAVRYQSRKRWVVKRPGKRAAAALVPSVMFELAEDDEALADALEAAVELGAVAEGTP